MAKLYFHYSTMNAGKTTRLLQSAFNYQERGMKSIILKPEIDDRDSSLTVKSRIGVELPSHPFNRDTNLFAYSHNFIEDLACVFVDEAQFLTEKQVDQLSSIVDYYEIPVMCYGLRTDFQGQLFEGSQRLLAIADELQEVKTICSCGSKATMVVRLNEDGLPAKSGEQVFIGGNDRYVSYCRKHWKEIMGHDFITV